MQTMQRIAAALTAGSMALTATPAAALNIYTYGDSSSNTSARSTSSQTSANTNANANVNASVTSGLARARVQNQTSVDARAVALGRCYRYAGEQYDECVRIYRARAEAQGDEKADIETHGQFVSAIAKMQGRVKVTFNEVETRLVNMLDRVFHAAAKIAKRACTNDDAKNVRECMDGIRARLELKINAMLDAAFSN